MSSDPSNSADRTRPGLFLPVLVCLVALAPLSAGLWMSWRIHEATSWPQAEARILSYGCASPTAPIVGAFDRGYQPILESVFEAQGRRWGCRRPLLFPGWFSEKEAREYSEEVGKRTTIPGERPGSFSNGVIVHYNPANPEESVVEANGRRPATWLIAVGALILLAGFALFANRRSQK